MQVKVAHRHGLQVTQLQLVYFIIIVCYANLNFEHIRFGIKQREPVFFKTNFVIIKKVTVFLSYNTINIIKSESYQKKNLSGFLWRWALFPSQWQIIWFACCCKLLNPNRWYFSRFVTEPQRVKGLPKIKGDKTYEQIVVGFKDSHYFFLFLFYSICCLCFAVWRK